MILVDANLLIYAFNSSAAQHEPSRAWLRKVLSGDVPICLAWSTIHAFLRLTTHPTLFPHPLTTDEAVGIVESWVAVPIVRILDPGSDYWTILRTLLRDTGIRGPRVMDAHLAALAIESGAVLYSTDRDFQRFRGLHVRNPLIDSAG